MAGFSILVMTITLLFFLVIAAGAIILQIFLSKRESKWPGLILPMIALIISIIAVLGVFAFTTLSVTGSGYIDENGVMVVEEEIRKPDREVHSVPGLIFSVAGVFLMYNIPTAVLLAIYFACREKQRRQKALLKMQIQDLE
jgi:energy-coupling factor transporter transmembrane protein EcfT